MDLIAVSDIYGDVRIVREFLSRISDSKKDDRVIVVVGDIDIKAYSTNYFRNVNRILKLLSKNCKVLFYVPGDSDAKKLIVTGQNIVNIDINNFIVKVNDMKIGLLGLGGAPSHSIREKKFFTYLWDENIPIVREGLMRDLKINLEKLMVERPDYMILVTHSPPYGIADYSRPITLSEEVMLEDILEEEEQEKEIERARKRATRNPRHLGSRMLKEFVRYYKPDIHIFSHVHKQGGKRITKDGTTFFNVSHLSPLPHRLTGRKYLSLELTKRNIISTFDSIVIKDLPFRDFLETYL